MEKTTKIDNEGYYQFGICSDRLFFLQIVQIFKGCKSPQPPHPRFEDRKWSVGLMVGVRPSDCRSVPGVAIRTNFLALSDRRPSRGPKFWLIRPRAEPSRIVQLTKNFSALGLALEHFFGKIRTVEQPNSQDSRSIFGPNQCFFSVFL